MMVVDVKSLARDKVLPRADLALGFPRKSVLEGALKEKKFPFQQGDLDDHCMIFAIINLLALRSDNRSVVHAQEVFAKLIQDIGLNGDLAAATTQGIDPEDFNWVLKKAGGKLSADCPAAKPKDYKKPLGARAAISDDLLMMAAQWKAVIFCRFHSERGEAPQTHYTVVSRPSETDSLELYDSYGYSTISQRGGRWHLDDEPITITDVFW